MLKNKKQQNIKNINDNFSKHDRVIREARKLERKLKRMMKEIDREIRSDMVFRLPNLHNPYYLTQPPYFGF
jgi:hypothetical protein